MTPHHSPQRDPGRPHPSDPQQPTPPRRSLRLLSALAVVLALLTGCSGLAQETSGDSADAPAGGAVADFGGDVVEEGAAASAADLAKTEVGVGQEYLVREAAIGLKVDDIAEAAGQVRRIATAAGGSVVNESFGDDYYGPASTTIDRYGSMTISVPSEQLDATIDELTRLGEVRTRSSNSQDVEAEFVDVEARIATLEASIARMRELMTQTDDIDQIVKLETALSSRQADLDALQARLNSLSARIDMSPVSVMLTTTDDLGEPTGGFLGALKDSWEAMKTSTGILITAAGALLPWVIVGALAIWALWALRKSLRRRRAQTQVTHVAHTPGAHPAQTRLTQPVPPTDPEHAQPDEADRTD